VNAHGYTPEHSITGKKMTMETVSAAAAHAALAKPEAGTLGTLRGIFGIPRSSAYELEARGEIRFIRLRKRGNAIGRVLVDFDSVRAYLARCAASDDGKAVAR
jgi:hypothetical protein